MKTTPLIILCILAIVTGCKVSTPSMVQRTWSVKEVQQMFNKDSSMNNTNCVLYRGTDNTSHHFLSQFIDKWVFMTIKKNELALPEERPFKVDSVAKLGYYYVDPNNHFVKIREFN